MVFGGWSAPVLSGDVFGDASVVRSECAGAPVFGVALEDEVSLRALGP
jgi:hypothetical protein